MRKHSRWSLTKDLSKDVHGHLPPREALPHGEGDGHGRVEVSTRCRCTSDNGKGDAQRECKGDLQQTAKGGIFFVEGEAGHGGDAGKNVEEDTTGLRYHLTQPSRPRVFEIKLALGDGLPADHGALDVLFDGIGGSELELAGMEL